MADTPARVFYALLARVADVQEAPIIDARAYAQQNARHALDLVRTWSRRFHEVQCSSSSRAEGRAGTAQCSGARGDRASVRDRRRSARKA